MQRRRRADLPPTPTPCRRCRPLPRPARRSNTLKKGDYVGWVQEYAICLLKQLHPRPVATQDVRLMRASFMLTHRVPAG